jgi:hypothetical protein
MHDYYHRRIAESFTRKLSREELETLVGLLIKVLSEK